MDARNIPAPIGNNSASVIKNFGRINWALNLPILISSGRTQYYLGDIRRLQDTFAQRVYVVFNSNNTLAADGTTLVAEASIDKCYLYLQDKKGDLIVDGLELSEFKVNTTSSATNPGYTFPGFDNIDIDWQKSYFVMPSATATTENGHTLQLRVQYVWKSVAQVENTSAQRSTYP